MRGEYTIVVQVSIFVEGSSPLAQGILSEIKRVSKHARIIPACAGNTFELINSFINTKDHPRLRGEYQPGMVKAHAETGSSPLARGILYRICIHRHVIGIIPACAGNTRFAISDDGTI